MLIVVIMSVASKGRPGIRRGLPSTSSATRYAGSLLKGPLGINESPSEFYPSPASLPKSISSSSSIRHVTPRSPNGSLALALAAL